MSNQKYICVDLDGTIAHYKEWEGETKFGDPIEGVQGALGELRSAGWKVIIYTTRGNQRLVEKYLQKHSIPFDYINKNPDQPKNAFGGKPYAEAYIDDRGIQFNGNWQATANEVLHFTPWEMRTELNQGDEYRKEAVGFLVWTTAKRFPNSVHMTARYGKLGSLGVAVKAAKSGGVKRDKISDKNG